MSISGEYNTLVFYWQIEVTIKNVYGEFVWDEDPHSMIINILDLQLLIPRSRNEVYWTNSSRKVFKVGLTHSTATAKANEEVM